MRRVVRLSLFVALASGASAAHAQPVSGPSAPAVSAQPGVNVYSTLYPRPPSSTVTQPNLPVPAGVLGPYQSAGYATDNVIWYPSITGAAFYDDNVFARHSNRQGDWAGVVRPELAWRTNNWANLKADRPATLSEALVRPGSRARSAQRRRRDRRHAPARREHPGRHPSAVSRTPMRIAAPATRPT